MDVRLPDGSGIEACREIRAEYPNTRVVMLTSYPDEEAVLSAIIAGASGYLLKQIRARDLVAALEAVGRGESLLDPAVTEKVLERIRRIASGTYADEVAQLTSQEQKILLLVAEGKTNKEIAADVFLSDKTVKNYVSSILSKLNLERRAQAAAFVAKHRIDTGQLKVVPQRPRIVEAAEAVAHIRSGDQVYLQCAAAVPSVLLDALVARAPELRDVSDGPPPHRGTRAAPGARDGAALPPPRPVHRPQRAARRQRRSGRLRARSSCRDVPRLFESRRCSRSTPSWSTPRRPTPMGSARSGRRVEAMHAAIRAAKTVVVAVQPRDAADARRQLHPRRRHRPRGRGRRAALRVTRPARSARSSGGSASYVADLVPDGATLQLGHRRHPGRDGAGAARTSSDLGIHTEMFTDAVVDLVEAGVITGARKERNRGQDRDRVHDGHAAPVRLRRRQPDGRDAPGRLHERHPRHPVVQPDDGDQLGDRGGPDGPGRGRLDRPPDVLAASAARWTSSAARPGARGPGDHRAAVDGGAAARSRASSRACRRAPAS